MKVNVTTLKLSSNIEDPDIFAAEPILEWQKTEQGKWIMENATEIPSYHITVGTDWIGYVVNITADLSEDDYTFWLLKWSK